MCWSLWTTVKLSSFTTVGSVGAQPSTHARSHAPNHEGYACNYDNFANYSQPVSSYCAQTHDHSGSGVFSHRFLLSFHYSLILTEVLM